MNKHTFITTFIATFLFIALSLTGCNSINSAGRPSTYSSNTRAVSSVSDPGLWRQGGNSTWYTLQHTPLHTLETAKTTYNDPTAQGWLSLAIISKKYSTNSQQLSKELLAWRSTYPSHPGNQLLPNDNTLNELANLSPPQNIAVLLPLHGPLASSGHVVRNGFLSAYFDTLAKTSQKQSINFYDTSTTSDIGSLYQKAAADGADLVVGPLSKPEVEALNRFNAFNVRVLTLNYTNASMFSSLPNNFYEFGLSPIEETQQMADKAHAAGFTRALVISSNDAWGHRVTDALKSRWQSNGGSITETLYFSKNTNLTKDIASLLHINPKEDRELMEENNDKSVLAEQRRQDFDVIFIFAQPDMGRQIVPLLRYYYAGKVPTYSISAIYSGRPSPSKDRDLDGVTFCETPWLIQMARSSNGSASQYDRLYAVGRDAYLLSLSLPRMNALPNFPLYGSTGALTMNQQQIHQRLPWVTMHAGQI